MAMIQGQEARYQAYLAMLKEDFTPTAQLELLYPDIVYISNGGTRILATQWGFYGDPNDYNYEVKVPYGYGNNVVLIRYYESSFGSYS